MKYADEKIQMIRETLIGIFGISAVHIPIFYGGSVNWENAIELSQCREINGLFIGRSAWDAEDFNALIRNVLRKHRL